MLDLPINGTLPHTQFNCQLDGATFGLEFRWNNRAAAWFMSIYDVAGTLLLANRRLVVAWGIIARFKLWNPALPPGDFVVFDTSGKSLEPGLNDLGTRCIVRYITEAEL